MTEIPREDWTALVGRLERYYRHIEIGAEVERSESWVTRLKRGEIRQPGHWEGEKLKAMDVYLASLIAAQVAQMPSSVSRETADPQVSLKI